MSSSDGTRFAEGVELLERAQALAEQVGDETALISCRRALGWSYLMDGRFEEAEDTLRAVQGALERRVEGIAVCEDYLDIRGWVQHLQQGSERVGNLVRFWGPLYPGSQEILWSYGLPLDSSPEFLSIGFPRGAGLLTREYA